MKECIMFCILSLCCFISCSKEKSILVNLKGFSEIDSSKVGWSGTFIEYYSFDENKCNDGHDIYANIYIGVSNSSGDTIVIFEPCEDNPFDALSCKTCDSYYLEFRTKYSIIHVPTLFKNSYFFNNKRYQYIFADVIVVTEG